MSKACNVLVIDANVLKSYFLEDTTGTFTTSKSSTSIFADLGRRRKAYIDSKEQIISEWKGVCDPEWFTGWYERMVSTGGVLEIDAGVHNEVINLLVNEDGFPRGSRDKWYVRVGLTIVDSGDSDAVVLLTEDIDFYDPKFKAHPKARRKVLRDCSGCVAKRLRKRSVSVKTVEKHLKEFQAANH